MQTVKWDRLHSFSVWLCICRGRSADASKSSSKSIKQFILQMGRFHKAKIKRDYIRRFLKRLIKCNRDRYTFVRSDSCNGLTGLISAAYACPLHIVFCKQDWFKWRWFIYLLNWYVSMLIEDAWFVNCFSEIFLNREKRKGLIRFDVSMPVT